MQAASLLHKNLLLETDGSLQDLQILCLEWQTRPYCPSKSTVTLWSTDPNKSIMFLSTTTLNQTKWVRLNRKGRGILNPFPHHPRRNKDKGGGVHWPFTAEPCSGGCPLGPGCPAWIWGRSIDMAQCNGFGISTLCQSNCPHSLKWIAREGKKGPYTGWIIRSDVLWSFSALPSQLCWSAVQIHSTEMGKALHR